MSHISGDCGLFHSLDSTATTACVLRKTAKKKSVAPSGPEVPTPRFLTNVSRSGCSLAKVFYVMGTPEEVVPPPSWV